MTAEQLRTLLSKLTAGNSLAEALAQSGITRAQYEAAIDADPDIGDIVDDTIEQARMGTVHEQRADELSTVIDAFMKPLPPKPCPMEQWVDQANNALNKAILGTPNSRSAPGPAMPARAQNPAVSGIPAGSGNAVEPRKPARVLPPEDEPKRPTKEDPEPDDDSDESEPHELDPDAIAREAAEFAPGMFGYLLWLEERLSDQGFHHLSDWWRYSLKAFYESGKQCGIFRVGRGGAKSTTLTRVAGAEGLCAQRHVPPGQRYIWPFISASTEDANRRIQEIQAILRAVDIRAPIKSPQTGKKLIDLNDIHGNRISFVSFAATIASVSGPTAIGGTIDEEAKLRDRTHNTNPASEILVSLLQTFRANPNARLIRSSSAWTDHGSHAESIAAGDTSVNYIARLGAPFLDATIDGLKAVEELERSRGNRADADRVSAYYQTLDATSPNVPTWIANPTVSAMGSRLLLDAMPARALEGLSSTQYWLRENASQPMRLSGPSISAASIAELEAMNRRLASNTSSPRTLDGPGSHESAEQYWQSLTRKHGPSL